ncbi:MAG: hypothetical protein CMK92_01055 [Pseudomonas sp.]|nr:hypothetical protein [Pseudomonas sp.]
MSKRDSVWWANVIAGVLHLAQSVAVFGLLGSGTGTESDWPILASGFEGEVLWLHRYPLGWLVPIFPLLSATNHFASAFSKTYDEYTRKTKTNPVRWIEYSMSAAIMLWIIGTLSGVNDVGTLASIVVLNIALMMVGYMAEALGPKHPQAALLQSVGFAIHLAIWTNIITSFYTTISLSDTSVPDVVYSIIWVEFVLFSTFGVLSALGSAGTTNFEQTEIGYIVLSFISKTLLTWLAFGGVFASNERIVEPTPIPP